MGAIWAVSERALFYSWGVGIKNPVEALAKPGQMRYRIPPPHLNKRESFITENAD